VILDSVAFACEGPPEAAETAAAYYWALRLLGVGSTSIAHITKAEGGDQKPFGSAFWHNGARKGLLRASALLVALIADETSERIELTTGIAIEVHTASFRSVRGYTVVGAVLDEIAFWPTDDSANPDTEILNAIGPAMATIEGALLMATSPYWRRGELWRADDRHFGKAVFDN